MFQYIDTIEKEISSLASAAGGAENKGIRKIVTKASNNMQKAHDLLQQSEELLLPVAADLNFDSNVLMHVSEGEDIDIDKIRTLTSFCRLRLAELKGEDCYGDGEGLRNNNYGDPDYKSEPREYFVKEMDDNEKDEIKHAIWQVKKRPKLFNKVILPHYVKRRDVLIDAINAFHSVAKGNKTKKEAKAILKDAINTGYDYLRIARAMEDSYDITFFWVIKQPSY